MIIYNVIVSGEKPADVKVYSYDNRVKALESARQLILYNNDGSMEDMISALRKSGKAFGKNGKKRFCIQIMTSVLK